MEAIWNNVVYARELESGYLPSLYYLVSWKGYLEEENIWEPVSAVWYLRKLINLFHKDHPDKLTAIFPAINTASSIARLTIRSIVKPIEPLKEKREQSANSTNKQAKKN